MPAAPTRRTDDEILQSTDVATLLRYGLLQDSFRTALFGDGVIAAAVTLDRLGVVPRAVSFVAKIVRAGGLRVAAALEEPLPDREAAALLMDWLDTSLQVAGDTEGGEVTVARWLDAVAEIMGMRVDVRRATGGRQR